MTTCTSTLATVRELRASSTDRSQRKGDLNVDNLDTMCVCIPVVRSRPPGGYRKRALRGARAPPDRDGALTNTFSERTVAVPPPQGPGEDAFSVHLGRFVPEGL